MIYDVSAVAKICSDKMAQLDVVSNNLANATTPGFKVDRLHIDSKKENLERDDYLYSSSVYVDYSQGVMQKTDNPLDVAIEGDGFFVVQTSEGPAYTRRGNFAVNNINQLVMQSGEPVTGEGGPIFINGKQVSIDSLGTITVDGMASGKFKIVRFDNMKALKKNGAGLFTDPGSGGAKTVDKPDLNQRYLESANVNAMKEMAEMIDVQRTFESYQKVIQTIQDMDKLSTSRLGRLA